MANFRIIIMHTKTLIKLKWQQKPKTSSMLKWKKQNKTKQNNNNNKKKQFVGHGHWPSVTDNVLYLAKLISVIVTNLN